MKIGKIQNTNTSFGYLYMEQQNQTKIPMAILCADADVEKELTDTFGKIHEASGEHRVTLCAREYRDSISIHLSSVKWPKILPSLSIQNGIGKEDKIEAIKVFREKTLQRLGIVSLPDVGDLFKKYSKK